MDSITATLSSQVVSEYNFKIWIITCAGFGKNYKKYTKNIAVFVY